MRKRIAIPYGKGWLPLELDEARLRGVLTPTPPAPTGRSEAALVQAALEAPIKSAPVRELAQGKQRILLITSDHTRPVPSAITLPLYLRELRAGSPNADIRILVATGMHRPTTPQELRQKFGEAIVDHETIIVHDAHRDEDMARFGTLPSGGELWLNKLCGWAELIVSEGFIEPHFFAGFSGGRKSVLPGVASQRTVLYNHNAGFIQNPLATQGSLEGNPIHRDMLYAAKAVGLQFILNVILNDQKKIIAAFAGDAEAAHAEGCRFSAAMTHVPAAPADIVITSNGGYPLDQNVYQSVKSMTAAEKCVREGGVIILCAALGDGHGGEAFYRWFSERQSAEEVLRDIQSIPPQSTRYDQWEAQILARVMHKAICVFVTGKENRALLEAMHLRWAGSLEAALALAQAIVGEASSVTVIPDGVSVIVDKG
ncbi:MAG: nickel-dependent lactate racemase [Clostridia bacterium]